MTTVRLSVVPANRDGKVFDNPKFFRLPGAPDAMFYAIVPSTYSGQQTPLVLVHGISRNAIELLCRFAPAARLLGIPLIAPYFPTASYDQYQQVRSRKSGPQSDLTLLAILDYVSVQFGVPADRIDIFGFSGGAQFAHRFTFLHPEKVRTCIPVSAGWYTMPDPAKRWPYGLAGAPEALSSAAIRAVTFHVMVGRRDSLDDAALRRSPGLDRSQGTNRLARARNWFRAMQSWDVNAESSFTVLPRTRHSFESAHRRGLVPLVFNLLDYPATGPGEEK